LDADYSATIPSPIPARSFAAAARRGQGLGVLNSSSSPPTPSMPTTCCSPSSSPRSSAHRCTGRSLRRARVHVLDDARRALRCPRGEGRLHRRPRGRGRGPSQAVGARPRLTDDQQRDVNYAHCCTTSARSAFARAARQPAHSRTTSTPEVKQHSEIGAQLLGRIPLLQSARARVRAIHERWDGGRLPRRLAGADIPIAARIVGAWGRRTARDDVQQALPATR